MSDHKFNFTPKKSPLTSESETEIEVIITGIIPKKDKNQNDY
jgi:hypothetical protein